MFDAETVAVASGDPLVETLVAADDLKEFLGDALRVLDLESAKKSGRYKGREKEVAARTVLKQHARKGHSKGA